MLCRRAILVPSGNAIRDFGVFTQPLAGADPAGVRKVGDAAPAGMRENECTVVRAAGRLAHRAAHLHRTCGAPQVQVSRSSRPLGSRQDAPMHRHDILLYVGDSRDVVKRILSTHCTGNVEGSALRLAVAEARGYPIAREKRPSGSTRIRIAVPGPRQAEHEISAFIRSCAWRYVLCATYEEAHDFQWYAIDRLRPQLNKERKPWMAAKASRHAQLLESLLAQPAAPCTDLDRRKSGPGVYLLSRGGV